MAPRPSWRLAAVVLVALVGLSALATLGGEDDEPDGSGGDPAAAFLEARTRGAAATYRTVSTFRRVSERTGAELTDRQVVAQRPPDRLFVDRDGARGLVDGRRLFCTYRRQRLRCQDARAEVSYEEDVARDLEALTEYVTGAGALYAVETASPPPGVGGECFALSLRRPLVAPPLGERARFCFDPATGAPSFTRIERVEATDEIRAVSISGEVTDADLDPATALDR